MFNHLQFKGINGSLNSSVNNSFSSRVGFEPIRPRNSSMLLSEKKLKQHNERVTNDVIFEHIKNPTSACVLNCKEREFISQVIDLLEVSEPKATFTEEALFFNAASDNTTEDNGMFVVPKFNKASGELSANLVPKENPTIPKLYKSLYSEDKERRRFMDYLKSQPSFKMYSETDRLACLDDLCGQDYNPTIFLTLYKLLLKVFKNEAIQASDFQLTPNEYQILESVLVRKYGAKIDKRYAQKQRQVSASPDSYQSQLFSIGQEIRGEPEVRFQAMLEGSQEEPA